MVHWYYPPQLGGVETLLQNICEELVMRGEHTVTVLASEVADCKPLERKRGVTIWRTPLLPFRPTDLTIDKCKALYAFLTKFLRKFDILHLNNFHTPQFSYQAISLYLAAKSNDIKPFLHIHGRPSFALDHFMIASIPWHRVIAISKWLKAKIIESGIARQRVAVVYNGVDVHRFHPELDGSRLRAKLSVEDDEKLIFCPSRLLSTTEGKIQTRKNLFFLLDACAILNKRYNKFKVMFTAVGSDQFKRETDEARELMRTTAQKLGIGDKLIIHEFSFDEIPYAHAASDVVVLPSIDEPFGIVYIEGMASGKPVIGTNTGAAPEVIRHGVSGYLVGPRATRDLANCLYKLLSDPRKAQQFGAAGRKLVEQKFSIASVVDALERLYRGS
jgi:hypothetical protein